MVVLGIVLVLIALLVGAALIVGTSAPQVSGQEVDIELLDAVTISLTPLTMVIAGMASMFLLWLGLVLIKTTLARKARQRRDRKAAELEARERHEREEAEATERARHAEGERQLEERRLRQQELDPSDHDAPPTPVDPTRPVPRAGSADETTPIARRRGDGTRTPRD